MNRAGAETVKKNEECKKRNQAQRSPWDQSREDTNKELIDGGWKAESDEGTHEDKQHIETERWSEGRGRFGEAT